MMFIEMLPRCFRVKQITINDAAYLRPVIAHLWRHYNHVLTHFIYGSYRNCLVSICAAAAHNQPEHLCLTKYPGKAFQSSQISNEYRRKKDSVYIKTTF